MTDSELLQQYVKTRSPEAFRGIVDRYLPMVHSAALRQVRDAHLAEDVCQGVFVALAQKAGGLSGEVVLGGWLYRATCYAAGNVLKAESRRRQHEALAMQQSSDSSSEAQMWEAVQPVLDQGMMRLREAERQVVLLRFFQDKSHADVAAVLGITPAAAQKRLERALGKLREYLVAKGVTALSVDALSGILLAHGATATAVPGNLAGVVVGAVSAPAAGVVKVAAAAKWGFGMAKAKVALAATVLGAVVLGGGLYAGVGGGPAAGQQASAATASGQVRCDGILVDEIGRPVSRAYICLPGDNVWRGARTDLEGKFVLPFKPGATRQILAYSQRSARMAVFTLPAGQQSPKIRLEYLEGKVEGRLVDQAGNAVANADMELKVTLREGVALPTLRARTDGDGDYAFGMVPFAEGVRLQVIAPQVANADENPIVVGAGQRLTQVDEIVTSMRGSKPGAKRQWLSGRLQNEAGEPIVGAGLHVLYDDSRRGFVNTKDAVTDQKGQWDLWLPDPVAGLDFRFMHPEYIGYHFVPSQTPPLERMKDGSAVTVMKRGCRIAGTIVDRQGNAVCNALVLAGGSYGSTAGPENEPLEDCTAVRTDFQGRFTVGGLAAGELPLNITTDDFAPAYEMVKVKDGADVRIVLEKGGEYRGRVVDGTGKPMAGARVSCSHWSIGQTQVSLTRIAKTDAEGRFELAKLPSRGNIMMYAGREGMPSVGWQRLEGATEAGDIRILSYPVVSGRVVDDVTGGPIRSFTVTAGRLHRGKVDDNTQFTVTNGSGRFERSIDGYILSREPDAFGARIVAEGYAPQVTPPVYPGGEAEPVTIRLKRATPIKGQVVDAGGQAVAGAEVAHVQKGMMAYVEGVRLNRHVPGRPDAIVESGTEGRFAMPAAELDGRILVLHERGYADRPASEFASEAKVTLTPWARIRGRLLARQEEQREVVLWPVSDDQSDPEPRWNVRAPVDQDGSFVLDHVPSVPAQVGVATFHGISHAVQVKPEPGRVVEVDLVGGAAVTGAVDRTMLAEMGISDPPPPLRVRVAAFPLDRRSKAVEGISPAKWEKLWKSVEAGRIDYQQGRLGVAIGATEAGGRFQVRGLGAGKWLLMVQVIAERHQYDACYGVVQAAGRKVVEIGPGAGSVEVGALALERVQYPGVGDMPPELKGVGFGGKSVDLAEFRGKVVVVQFWGVMPQFGREEAAAMKRLADKWVGKVQVVGVCFDWGGADSQKLAREWGMSWPQIRYDRSLDAVPFAETWGLGRLPTVWVIGPDGRVVAKDVTPAELEDAVLGKAPSEE